MKGITCNQLLDLETVDPSPIWGPTICTHNLVMVYGGTGLGKTITCMKLAHTISAGGVWLQWGVVTPRRVLYVDGELGLAAMKRRFRAIQAEAPFSPRGDHFRVLSKDHCGPRLWNIADPADQKKYNEAIGHSDVVVFDNLLSCVFPMHSRDDDVRQWERILPWFHALRDSGRTVIVVHHTGKSGTQLGTSVKENWLDTNIELKLPDSPRSVRGTEFEWRFKKTRDVKRSDAQNMLVTYAEDDDGVSRWTWLPLTSTQTDVVRDLKAQGKTRREVAKQTGLSFKAINDSWEGPNV